MAKSSVSAVVESAVVQVIREGAGKGFSEAVSLHRAGMLLFDEVRGQIIRDALSAYADYLDSKPVASMLPPGVPATARDLHAIIVDDLRNKAWGLP